MKTLCQKHLYNANIDESNNSQAIDVYMHERYNSVKAFFFSHSAFEIDEEIHMKSKPHMFEMHVKNALTLIKTKMYKKIWTNET